MITILTPTYNREQTLRSLYESLVDQTQRDFEWLIIDDGSNDSTENLIAEFIKVSPFSIRYVKKENGGKHSALNIGFKEAKYDWIFMVDSDDTLRNRTIETLNNEISQLSIEFNSVSILRVYTDGSVIGEEFPSGLNSYLDKIYSAVKGDKADVIRKSALVNFSFPIYPNEKFMAESPLFIWLGSEGKTKFINYKGYVCEYLPDGLTDSSIKNRHKCTNSTLFVYYNQYEKLKSNDLKAKAAINWWRFRIFKTIDSSVNNRIPFIFFPLGLFLYINDRIKKKIK